MVPYLSILISTRNHAHFLEQCLRSLQLQTFTNIEILVFNDGSTDNTSEILGRFSKNDPRIIAFKSSISKGPVIRFNYMLNSARGSFIWGLGSDDFCIDPFFLEKGFKGLKKYPMAAGFFSATKALHMPCSIFGKIWGPKGNSRFMGPAEVMDNFFKHRETSPGPSCVLRTYFYKKTNGLNPELGAQSDYFLNNMAGASRGLVYINEPCVIFRVWDNHKSFSGNQQSLTSLVCFANLEIALRHKLPVFRNDLRWRSWRAAQIASLFNLSHKLHRNKLGFVDYLFFPSKFKIVNDGLRSYLKSYFICLTRADNSHYFDIFNCFEGELRFVYLSYFLNRIRKFLPRIKHSFKKRLAALFLHKTSIDA